MNESKHTPGKWEIEGDNDEFTSWYLVGPARVHIGYNPSPEFKAETEANVRLIAAAPDLYEACKNFREWWANHFEDYDSVSNGELLYLDNDFEAALNRAEKEGT